MTTATQDKDFLSDVVGDTVLEKAVEWIGKNLDPEEVFSASELETWATDNGFSQDED